MLDQRPYGYILKPQHRLLLVAYGVLTGSGFCLVRTQGNSAVNPNAESGERTQRSGRASAFCIQTVRCSMDRQLGSNGPASGPPSIRPVPVSYPPLGSTDASSRSPPDIVFLPASERGAPSWRHSAIRKCLLGSPGPFEARILVGAALGCRVRGSTENVEISENRG